MELNSLTIRKIREGIKNKEFSAEEVANSYLRRINKFDGETNAYLEVFDDVRNQAREIDSSDSEDIGPLAGVPVAVKDNILIKGKNVSAASGILEGYTAAYNATAIEKLKSTGAVLLGRTNMDEFAMGSSTENSAFGVVRNPADRERVPGGSSGGSAAAVGMNEALVGLGSDTGGSVRQPASWCGLVGLKPTYGSVSRYGLIAMGSSLDVIGPLAKNVEDAEILYNVVKGRDKMDSTSVGEEDYPSSENKKEVSVIGVPSYLEEIEINSSVRARFDESLEALKRQGYEIKTIDLSTLKYALAAYYIIMPAEASANLARFDGVKYGLHVSGEDLLEDYVKTRGEGFGQEVRRRIILGTYVLSAGYYDAYYRRAVAVREKVKKDVGRAFEEVDVIATPTAPDPAFGIGEKADPLSVYLTDIFTVPANLAGIPAISVPAGTVREESSDLPVGIQFSAPYMREDVLFRVGKDLEKE